MESKTGVVSKIKVLKMSEQPLVFFKLDNENCLISYHSLKFLADVDSGMRLAVAGFYNSRKQFVVKKFSVLGKTRIMIDIENIQYNDREKVFICKHQICSQH